MKGSTFWDIMPCNPLTVNRCFGGTCRLHLQDRINQTRNQHEEGSKQKHTSRWFILLPASAVLFYCSTLRMEAICSSETLDFLRTIRRYNTEDRKLHSYRRDNLKSNTVVNVIRRIKACRKNVFVRWARVKLTEKNTSVIKITLFKRNGPCK
jgi:hypothetical protein